VSDTRSAAQRALADGAAAAARRAKILFDANRPADDDRAIHMLEAATRALAQAGAAQPERAAPVRLRLRVLPVPGAGARARRPAPTRHQLHAVAARVLAVLVETGVVPPELASKIASTLGKKYQRPKPQEGGTGTDGDGGEGAGTGDGGGEGAGPGTDSGAGAANDPNDPGLYVATVAIAADGTIDLTAGEEVVVAAPIEAGVPASVAAAIIGLIGLVFAVLTIPSDEAVPETPKPTEEECKKIKDGCIDDCTDTSLPTPDFGFKFWNCVNKCVADQGC
jgi:hypothetical protein